MGAAKSCLYPQGTQGTCINVEEEGKPTCAHPDNTVWFLKNGTCFFQLCNKPAFTMTC